MNNHNSNSDSVIYNSWQFLSVSQLCNHNFVHLERPSSWSASRICPPRPQSRFELRLLFLSFMSILLVCFGPPSILLFTPMAHVSRSPFLFSRQLNTNVQVNNMAVLHHIYTGTHTHICITSTYNTIQALLHTSSTPLGRPAGSDWLSTTTVTAHH